MLKRLQFLALYGLSWIFLFQFFRVIFLLYHYQKALELPSALLVRSALHGFRMDLSFASYIVMIPALLLAFTAKKWDWYRAFMLTFSFVISLAIVLLTVIDLELFKAWGFRIDATSLHYLDTPKEAFASMGAAPVIPLILLFLILLIGVNVILNTVIRRCLSAFNETGYPITIPFFILIAGTLIIPIRGGLQLAPMNESAVFFSDKSFANYAAVNVPWNYANSLVNATFSKKNPFVYFDENKADKMVADLYRQGNAGSDSLIKKDGPVNVVLIIWESFTAKVAGSVGGDPRITPQFDKLSKEGILFTNMYASGNRSDKGMVSILSGYPAQPTNSIIKIPKKTASLPALPREFARNGWNTSFYYGGETEFAT